MLDCVSGKWILPLNSLLLHPEEIIQVLHEKLGIKYLILLIKYIQVRFVLSSFIFILAL